MAMAITYSAAGVMAGLFGAGANIQAAFQTPWILGAFAALFVALALSMFGLYDIQLPSAWQSRLTELSNKQHGGTYAGVAALGVLSALIVGPCVAAPLAGALIYIGQTGDAVLGGSALFAMSLGMGTPVLIVGTTGSRFLPKAGPWMKPVKGLFGIALLGVAIYLLERVLPERLTISLWGTLIVGAGIFVFWAFSPQGFGRAVSATSRGLAGLTTTIGLVVITSALLPEASAFRWLPTGIVGTPMATAVRPFQPIKGLQGLERELAVARTKGQGVMLDFYADWCVSCKELERDTFPHPDVQRALARFHLLRADVTANDSDDVALLERFGLFGPPAILFFDHAGVEQAYARIVGFVDAKDFLVRLDTDDLSASSCRGDSQTQAAC
jgi:thiol:disulfide interchange protein DsbD